MSARFAQPGQRYVERPVCRWCSRSIVWVLLTVLGAIWPALVYGQSPQPTFAPTDEDVFHAAASRPADGWAPAQERQVTTIYWPSEDPANLMGQQTETEWSEVDAQWSSPDTQWANGEAQWTDPEQELSQTGYQAPLESAQLDPAPWVQQPSTWTEDFNSEPFVKLQTTRVMGSYLAGKGNELGISDIDLRSVFAFPGLPGFSVMPGFVVHYLNGPTSTDLPPRLYNAYAEFRWMRPLSPRWSYEIAVAPGIYSDFDQSSSDAIRITGRGLAFYGLSQQLQLVMGIVYLDRENIRILPAGGIIYSPNPETRYELIFPRPKISKRYFCSQDLERWVYLAGEFGGGSWAIKRVSGADDVVTYSDIRMILGLETKYASGRSLLYEVAYVFDRQVEYKSGVGNYDPDGTVMLRVGLNF